MMAIVVDVFGYGIFALQLWTGFAYVGWLGDNGVIERPTRPGPYWYAMVLQGAVLLVYTIFRYQ